MIVLLNSYHDIIKFKIVGDIELVEENTITLFCGGSAIYILLSESIEINKFSEKDS